MERDIIATSVDALPLSALGEIQADHEIWEVDDDNGARFKVTRHMLPGMDKQIISLSVAGVPKERNRVIDEFIEVLGAPYFPPAYDTDPGSMEVVAWLVDNAEAQS